MNEYHKKLIRLARDGKIRPGKQQSVIVIHEGWCPCLRDPNRNECICRPDIRGID